jgi:hypothetical protein
MTICREAVEPCISNTRRSVRHQNRQVPPSLTAPPRAVPPVGHPSETLFLPCPRNYLRSALRNSCRPRPYSSLVDMTPQLHHQPDLRPLQNATVLSRPQLLKLATPPRTKTPDAPPARSGAIRRASGSSCYLQLLASTVNRRPRTGLKQRRGWTHGHHDPGGSGRRYYQG